MIPRTQLKGLSGFALQDPALQDAARFGQASADLARARALGLPVLPALVIDLPKTFSRQKNRVGIEGEVLLRRMDAAGIAVEILVAGSAALAGVLKTWRQQVPLDLPLTVWLERPRAAGPAGRMFLCSPRGVSEPVLRVLIDDDKSPRSSFDVNLDLAEETQELPALGMDFLLWRRLRSIWETSQQHFGQDVRVDWQVFDGQPWVRAIGRQDRRHVVHHLGAQVSGPELWTSFVLREDLSLPLSPLSADLWQHHFLPIVFETLTGLPDRATRERRLLPVDLVSGRLYWSVNRLLATPSGRLMLRLGPRLDPAAWPVLHRALHALPLQAPPLASLRKVWATGKSLGALWRLLRQAFDGLHARRCIAEYRRQGRAALSQAGEDLQGLSDSELVATLAEVTAQAKALLRRGLPHELLAAGLIHLGQRLWPRGSEHSFEQQLRGLAPSPSADLLSRLRALAATPAQDLAQDPRWTQLLQTHGHRCPAELDVAAPRWFEQDHLLQQCLNKKPLAPLVRKQTNSAGSRLGRWLQTALWPVVQLREWPRWAFSASLWALRSRYLELGRRLVQRSQLRQLDDLWLAEQELLLDLLLQRRHDLDAIYKDLLEPVRERWRDSQGAPAPLLLSADGRDWPMRPMQAAELDILHGAAASPGQVWGRARVVTDPHCHRLQAGEILVTPSFTAAWAPLLLIAGGLVTEVGDLASVAALIARNQSLPAVTGVAGACEKIQDGAGLWLDGDQGELRLSAWDPRRSQDG